MEPLGTRRTASVMHSVRLLLLLVAVKCCCVVKAQTSAPGIGRCISYPTQCCGIAQCLDSQSPTLAATVQAYSANCGDPLSCSPLYYTICSLNSSSSECVASGVFTLPPTLQLGTTVSGQTQVPTTSPPLQIPRCITYPKQCCGAPVCLDTQAPTFLQTVQAYQTACGGDPSTCDPLYFTMCSLNAMTSTCVGSGVYSLAPGVTFPGAQTPVSGHTQATPSPQPMPRCISLPGECCGEPRCLDSNSTTYSSTVVSYAFRCGDPTACNPVRLAVCSLDAGGCKQTGTFSVAPGATGPFGAVTTASTGRQEISSTLLWASLAAACAFSIFSRM
eukprot:scpid75562/ scgid23948/ 